MAHALEKPPYLPVPSMLALSVQSPFASLPRPLAREDVVASAIEAAGTVSGAYATSPCTFVTLPATVAPLLDARRPDGTQGGTWLLVTVRATGEPGQRVHLHERCLTAVQRVMLALACDGVDSVWVGEGLPDAEALLAAGAPVDGRSPVGLVWCATG